MEIKINIPDDDLKKLEFLLDVHNKGVSEKRQLDMQQYAQVLMAESIYYNYKLMKSI